MHAPLCNRRYEQEKYGLHRATVVVTATVAVNNQPVDMMATARLPGSSVVFQMGQCHAESPKSPIGSLRVSSWETREMKETMGSCFLRDKNRMTRRGFEVSATVGRRSPPDTA